MTCYDDKFLQKEPLNRIMEVDDEGRDILNSIVKITFRIHLSAEMLFKTSQKLAESQCYANLMSYFFQHQSLRWLNYFVLTLGNTFNRLFLCFAVITTSQQYLELTYHETLNCQWKVQYILIYGRGKNP